VVADQASDLALLRIAAPRAPALLLATPRPAAPRLPRSAFGGGGGDGRPRRASRDPARPAGPDRVLPRPHLATVITAAVALGDSGAPVVDARGRARAGRRAPRLGRHHGGRSELRALLRRAGIANARGRSGALFARALARLWTLDLAGARRGLEARCASTPDTPSASRELRRVGELASARLALEPADRRTAPLRALSAASAVAAAACGSCSCAVEGAAGRGAACGVRTEPL